MHRFDVFTSTHPLDHSVNLLEQAMRWNTTADRGGWSYSFFVPAAKADGFRAALQTAIDQHNQHYNMPRLTVFETIGWGFSQL